MLWGGLEPGLGQMPHPLGSLALVWCGAALVRVGASASARPDPWLRACVHISGEITENEIPNNGNKKVIKTEMPRRSSAQKLSLARVQQHSNTLRWPQMRPARQMWSGSDKKCSPAVTSANVRWDANNSRGGPMALEKPKKKNKPKKKQKRRERKTKNKNKVERPHENRIIWSTLRRWRRRGARRATTTQP